MNRTDPLLGALASVVATMPNPYAQPQVTGLENELAAAYGRAHAVAVSSGTAALHTALAACGIGPGDEILMPAATVVMTVAAITATGARPVFVDATPDGDPMDPADLRSKLTPRTRAVLPVHLFGRSTTNLDAIQAVAAEAGLRVIEDACQAQESRLGGRPLGTIGDIGCFSLKDGKIVSCGEGGYLITDDAEVAADARAFRSHWQTGAPGVTPAGRLGLNYRLAEPLAALARTALADRDHAVAARRRQTDLLVELVGDIPGMHPLPDPPEQQPNGYAACWRLTLPHPRDLCVRLAGAGVPNSIGTFGLRAASAHPACRSWAPTPCPQAENLIDTLLAVPLCARDTDERIAELAVLIRREATAWRASC